MDAPLVTEQTHCDRAAQPAGVLGEGGFAGKRDREADRRHHRRLKTVYDPEIPADIYELGLIYRVDIEDDRSVEIDMTLTAPACPVAGEMPKWVQDAVEAVPGVQSATVNMVFDPPWDQSRMSDEARMALDMW